MKSMTGFGQGQLSKEGLTIQVEISSVNRKNLDLHFSLPRGLASLEARCQKIISDSCARGRIQTRVILETSEKTGKIRLNKERAKEWLCELNTFASEEGLQPVNSVVDVLRFPRVMEEVQEEELESVELWSDVEKALKDALKELVEMRIAEGAHLYTALTELASELSGVVKKIKPLLPEARKAQEEKIKAVVSDWGTLSPEMQNRVYQEMALQAEKADVQEEIVRLEGHLKQMAEKVTQEEPVGRALDFLCQELARELNTLSVKVSSAEVNQLALAGKECVEKIREQVQNVE